MKIRKLVLVLAFAVLSFGFTSGAKTKMLTYESTVLTFSQNSSELDSIELAKLQQSVSAAKAKGKIVRAELAVWSDLNHPVTGALSKADEKLVNLRISDVKQALKKDLNVGYKFVKTYNMAENANWLGRHFNSSEAQLDELYAKNARGSMAREDLSLIKRDGAPSKAVVILKIQE